MKTNIEKQFEQFFRMFKAIVEDFNDIAWSSLGHGLTVPSNLSFHILQSIKFYTKNVQPFHLYNGEIIEHNYKVNDRLVISKNDIINNIQVLQRQLSLCIKDLDLGSDNTDFPWTGEDMENVVIFIIRHSYFHLGELNVLINEYMEGKAEDHFAKNIY